MRVVQRLPQRWRGLAEEIAKFGTIGVVNTIVAFAVFNLLLPIGSIKANTVATVVAATGAYFMNRHWTYRHLPKSTMRREYSLFFGFNIVGLAIESSVLFLVAYILNFDEQDDVVVFNIAKFGGLAIATVFRFWAYRRFVFGATVAVEPTSAPLPTQSGAAERTSDEEPAREDVDSEFADVVADVLADEASRDLRSTEHQGSRR